MLIGIASWIPLRALSGVARRCRRSAVCGIVFVVLRVMHRNDLALPLRDTDSRRRTRRSIGRS
jgi:hypothetical protein